MNLKQSLDINKLSLYISKIKNTYNSYIIVDNPSQNFYTIPILTLIEYILVKQLFFDKNYWEKNYKVQLDETPEIKKIIKNIEKQKKIGQGYFGSVYKVKSNIFKGKKIDSDIVAVKIEEFNWQRSFNIIKNLKNSIKMSKLAGKINIGPKLYDAFIIIDDDNIKIIKIFEYIEGETLNNKIWKSNSEEKEIYNNLRKIVSKMNKAGIIHYDIHKGNIMITNSNKIYIIDYDFAKPIEKVEQNSVNDINRFYSPYPFSIDLINYVYNNCIKDGIINFN